MSSLTAAAAGWSAICPPLFDLMIVERLYPCDWNSSMADWRASSGWWKEGREVGGVGGCVRESRSTEKEIDGSEGMLVNVVFD